MQSGPFAKREVAAHWKAATLALGVAFLLTSSCGESATSHDAENSECETPTAVPIWGKQYSAENDCIDTEKPIEAVGCNLVPTDDSDDRFPDPGFHCVRRLADGAEFWAFAFHDFGFEANQYELCDNRSGVVPRPCYATDCIDAPRSSCSLAQTRKHFACNAEGGYDEGCCGRPVCEQDADCDADQECRRVAIGGMWECWDNPGNPCDCGGPAAAYMGLRCVPKSAEAEALGVGCVDCTRRPIGAPLWEPVQARAFAATIGSLDTGPEPYFEWQANLFGPYHTYSPSNGFVPGVAHEGPYESEIALLADEAGVTSTQSFLRAEFTEPSGVILLVMIAPGPGAPRGSSPDFDEGSIIGNDVFPIRVTGGLYQGGEPYDLDLSGTYVGYDQLVPPIVADGASHFFLGFGLSSAFGPPGVDVVGDYVVRARAIDSVGEGWEFEIPFTVVD